MSDQRRRTRQGHAIRTGGDWEEHTDVDFPPRPTAARAAAPPIEVCYVQENRVALGTDPTWRALEVWTGNHVYMMDSDLVCVAVANRQTGRPDPRHAFLGARLTGGERYEGNAIGLSYPLPVPGTGAVFRHRTAPGRASRFGTTSLVERVVLRVRLIAVDMARSEAAWEAIVGVGGERPRSKK